MASGLKLAARKAAEEKREAAIQEAFKKDAVLQTQAQFNSTFFFTSFGNLRRKCRKLAESPQAWLVLHRLLRFQKQWVNDVDSWKPRGKAVDTLLRSLIQHLICKYPMPTYWFEVWFQGTEHTHHRGAAGFGLAPVYTTFCDLFVCLAQGVGLVKLVKDGSFPVNFTKKQCHLFMQQRKVTTVIHAIRRTQVQSFGGERSLVEALCATEWGEELGHRLEEDFRSTVVQWLSAQAMLDMTQVGPLIDYITHSRRNNAMWAIRGRTVASLMRDMEEWHRELARDRLARRVGRSFFHNPPPEKFASCGLENWFHSRETKDKKTGRKIHENHKIEEILSYERLREEGRELHHCVTSYVWTIDRGVTSIWSYSVDKKKVLTLELHNPTRKVVQIRGLQNRMPTASEMNAVERWAQKNTVLIAPRAIRRGW